MGRVRVVCIKDSELQGGSPRLCRLRTASVAPLQQALIVAAGRTGCLPRWAGLPGRGPAGFSADRA
jgi:hypothetical protein